MTDAATDGSEEQPAGARKGGLGLLALGLVLALAGGGAGHLAATSGILASLTAPGDAKAEAEDASVFVDVPPMIVTIAQPGGLAQLRLKLSLETGEKEANAVAATMPRILDVLNTYLRAVETVDIGDPTTLVRLRAQMLRRVQVVAGDDMVRDLLIQEFVVN